MASSLLHSTPKMSPRWQTGGQEHASPLPPPLILTSAPSIEASPAKRARVAEPSIDAAAAVSLLSPRSEDELSQIFAQSCRCGMGQAANGQAATGGHVHLDLQRVNASLGYEALTPLTGQERGMTVLSAVRMGVCQCIRLPQTCATVAAPATSAAASAGSHKRRHVSPPGTPAAAAASSMQHHSLDANVVKPLPSAGGTASAAPRSVVRVRKHGGAAAGGPLRSVSPCSLTVSMREDDDEEDEDDENDDDDDGSAASGLSSPVSPVAAAVAADRPLSEKQQFTSPGLCPRAAAAELNSRCAAASSRSLQPSPQFSLASSSGSPLLSAARSPQPPLSFIAGGGCSSAASFALDSFDEDGASCSADDAADLAAAAASAAEIAAIEAEERESELAFIMNGINQDTSSMPYIL